MGRVPAVGTRHDSGESFSGAVLPLDVQLAPKRFGGAEKLWLVWGAWCPESLTTSRGFRNPRLAPCGS
jgi:hypothetical protein